MAIKDILTIVDLVGERAAPALAAELARVLDAHLMGMVLAQNPMIPPSGIALGSEMLTAGMRDAWLRQAQDADAAFEDMAGRAGVRYESRIIEAAAESYTAEPVRRSRLTDLVVVGQDSPDAPQPMRGPLIEALLFDGGAPTLIVPYIGAADFALRRALVAWDGSATAARAVRASLPLLAACDSVTVLAVGSQPSEEETDIAIYLDRHGLKVEVKQIPAGSIPVADTVLNVVSDESFDCVVMGAYGHSRVREYFFGGATRDILGEMTVPVLMTH
jgi:nucleotide-binding universal stress UspA family protein